MVSALFLGALGCGGGPKEAKDVISGKVTLSSQPVAGTITFKVGEKESMGPISPDGSYKVENPPIGDADVLIKGFLGAAGGAGGTQPIKEGSKGTTMPGGGTQGVAPPKKYETTAGGLKHTVTAGKTKKDFELTP